MFERSLWYASYQFPSACSFGLAGARKMHEFGLGVIAEPTSYTRRLVSGELRRNTAAINLAYSYAWRYLSHCQTTDRIAA